MPAAYPTPEHRRAADAIVGFFAGQPGVDAVVLVNSCARGRATPDSCLDVQVLVGRDRDRFEAAWQRYQAEAAVFAELRRAGLFAVVHLDVVATEPRPGPIADDEPLDPFELEVGNLLVYGVPLWQQGDRLAALAARWLPYYGDDLRAARLAAARSYVRHHLAHVRPYLARRLYFQSFDRFYRAFQGFLMALHVGRRVYPIAYDKWIEEQVAGNLGLPELYARLPRLFEIGNFESDELAAKAAELDSLLERYASP